MGVQVYAIGVDWAGEKHDVCVLDREGRRILNRSFDETTQGFEEFGRILDEWSEQGIELVACIEKPEGLVIDLLGDHNVKVYPVNPKSLNKARELHRVSGARDDQFDAFVLADFIRTHYQTLRPIEPNSPQMTELKILTRDHDRQVTYQRRVLTQLRAALKTFYLRPLEVFGESVGLLLSGIRVPRGIISPVKHIVKRSHQSGNEPFPRLWVAHLAKHLLNGFNRG